ncbi:MAG: enoyl-CoA hydratase/isomerase family protein, partial [Gemmataceae bacterium]
MTGETLKVTEADGIVTITFARPERRNALNRRMIEDLIAAIGDLGRRSSGVLVLTGEAPSFCAGLDLEELQSLRTKTRAEHKEDTRRIARLMRSLFDLPLPTIAAVNGHAIAGGMGLATVCDFTLSVPEAKFGYTEARIGFVPAIVSSFLAIQVGGKRARDLLLSARLITAEEAREWGLVNEIVGGRELP